MTKVRWAVGLDYSMSCPAITIVKDGDFSFERCHFYYISDKAVNTSFANIRNERLQPFANNEERFDRISDWALRCIVAHVDDPNVGVFIEDYSYGSKGKTFHIAENAGLVKHKLFKQGFNIQPIPPTVIKKHATGKGNATKESMYEAFVLRTGVELMKSYQPKAKSVGSPVGDIVDSYYVALCGYEGVGLNTPSEPHEED